MNKGFTLSAIHLSEKRNSKTQLLLKENWKSRNPPLRVARRRKNISGKPPKNYLCISPLQNAECGLRNARKNLIKEEGHFQNPPNQKNKAYEEILLSPKHYTFSLRIPTRRSWIQKSTKIIRISHFKDIKMGFVSTSNMT